MLILEHLQSIDSSTSSSREVGDDNVQKCLRFAEESGLYDAGDDMQQNLDSDMTEQLVDGTQSTNLEEIRRQAYDNRRNEWKKKLSAPPGLAAITSWKFD